MRQIVPKDGAPSINQLHMELRVSARLSFEPKNYQYHPPKEGEEAPSVNALIGRPIENVFDAISEERLLFREGDFTMEEILGVYDRTFREVGHNEEIDAQNGLTEYETLRYEFVLADENGTVWTELVEMPDMVEIPPGPVADAVQHALDH